MRNLKAVLSLLLGLLALGELGAVALLDRIRSDVSLREVGAGVGIGVFLALVSLSLARRARFDYQRTLGRIGGSGVAVAGRLLGTAALLVSLTAASAFGVYAVLTLVLS